jgi:myo-inositol-1(or 4)-monophosphatase
MTGADTMQMRLLAAEAVAREAGTLARRRFLDSSFNVRSKGPQDYVTEVDGQTEELISGRLLEVFPDDGFIGEETQGRRGREGGAVWVVDPIDGTANFVRGVAHFCVSVGCVALGRIEVGVIYDPMREELFSARRGGGARLNGAAIQPSKASALAESSIEVGWNGRMAPARHLDLTRRIALTGATPIHRGSGALAVAYVSTGRSDGYVELHINAWDCLAGILLVSEAGGYVSDFLAHDGLTKGNPLIACAPGLKDALVSTAAIEGILL